MGNPVPFDGELLEECSELLAGLKAEIPSVREASPDRETLVRMQRHAHTVKGLVGFLGMPEMNGLASRLAETLRRLRDGETEVTQDSVDEIAAHTTKLTELLAAAEVPARPAGPEDVPPPASRDTRKTMVFSEPRQAAAGTGGPSWSEPQTSACRGKVRALSGAVAEVLFNFGVERASCGRDSVGEFAATASDLTVVANAQGELGAAIVFGFDSGVAQALAGKISATMFGGAVDIPASEQAEFTRGALGEMVSFTLLATLNTLGLPPEFAAPTFVKGKGVKLSPVPRAARSFSVATEFGEFEVDFAPGVSLGEEVDLAGGEPESAAYRRRVVIADDSSVMRKTLERVLAQAGYDVVAHASDGRLAIEEFRRQRPDLLVLDISMPVMGGLDALKIIRAEDPSARVLICSAIAESKIIKRGLKAGAVGYVTKPFKAAKLIETIEDLFEERDPQPAASPVGGPAPLGTPTLGIYRVGQPLGEGGMATVYEGYDPGLGRKVALKVINDTYASDVDFVVRFLEEARAVAKVNDLNVVTIYFAGSDRGKHFFAMELLPGPNLADLVERQEPRPVREALSYLQQAARGLAAAGREGLIHCDVKPSNLVFGSDGFVKVTDFGIARQIGAREDATDSEILGTPWFMAPEQVMEQPVDHRTDIYSLGATLYFLLTGKPPYDGDDGAEVALRQVHDPVPTLPKAPRKVRRLLGRMMAKSLDARHAGYDELLRDIERLV